MKQPAEADILEAWVEAFGERVSFEVVHLDLMCVHVMFERVE